MKIINTIAKQCVVGVSLFVIKQRANENNGLPARDFPYTDEHVILLFTSSKETNETEGK